MSFNIYIRTKDAKEWNPEGG